MKKNYSQHIVTVALAVACVAIIAFNMMPRVQTVCDMTVDIQTNEIRRVSFGFNAESLLNVDVTTTQNAPFEFTLWTKADYAAIRRAIEAPSAESIEAALDAKPVYVQDSTTSVSLKDHPLPAGEYVLQVANTPENAIPTLTATIKSDVRPK